MCVKAFSASPSLSFRPLVQQLFRDVVEAIAMIEQFTIGRDIRNRRQNDDRYKHQVIPLLAARILSGGPQPTLAADETTDPGRDRVDLRAGNPNHRSCRRVKLDQRSQLRRADSEDCEDSADERPAPERCDRLPKHAWQSELG